MAALLVLFLLVFTFVVSVGQRIRAKPGENVILPCRAAENRDVILVEWSRPDLESDQYVLLYKDNQFDLELQPPSFRNRVDLLDVKNGDVSLVLKNVTTDDTGTYECRVDYTRHNRRKRSLLNTEPISTVDLIVEQDQRIIRAEPGENVTLTCRADENREVIVVEWSRTDLESDQFVILYRNNQFDPELQSPSFRNRVDLLDVKNGDVSLVLKNVTTDDTGRYECRVFQELISIISIIDLRVEPGNKEKLKKGGGNEDGPKEDGGNEDGGNWTGLIVGLSAGFFALVSLFGFLLYKYQRHLHQEQNPSAAAGVEHERMNPENRPPAGE